MKPQVVGGGLFLAGLIGLAIVFPPILIVYAILIGLGLLTIN